MDENVVRALLTVMDITAPEGTSWCAWQPSADYLLADEYRIRDHWRFYLVEDKSELHNDKGYILWGN